MYTSILKKRLYSGEACVNGWLAIPDGLAAETMAQCGWHSLTVDMQHGVQDYISTVECLRAIEKYPVTPLVRVPWNEPGIIGKVLDGGAWGIICPMINNAAEALALASYALYPPAGKRSSGPIRVGAYGVPGRYQEIANDEVLIIPMIETEEAVDNIDAILDVAGVSGIYVGPADLGLSLGLAPLLDREERRIMAIYDKLLAAVDKRGLFAGLHNNTPGYAAKMIDKGFRLVTVANDSSLLAMAARAAVEETNGLARGQTSPAGQHFRPPT